MRNKLKNDLTNRSDKEVLQFLLNNDKEFEDLYSSIRKSTLALLPQNVALLVSEIEHNENIEVNFNYHHTFNCLFTDLVYQLVLKHFRKICKDIEFTDDKVLAIYSNFNEDWIPDVESAEYEISKFIDFTKILNSK